MEITKGYVGGTPATWDVTIPDVSGVDGFQSAWMLESGVATSWSLEVAQADLGTALHFPILTARDGQTVQLATNDGLVAGAAARAANVLNATELFGTSFLRRKPGAPLFKAR
jgi:hypothetical protein